MRVTTLLSSLAAITTLALAVEQVIIKNHLAVPVWYTTVDQTGYRSETFYIGAHDEASLDQSDRPGVAVKITPDRVDIDTPGKGVLILAYNKHPDGWIYYDLSAHNYFPFAGSKTKLGGPGSDNDWNDGQKHDPHTVGYQGHGDLYLDIGY
ncbi:uncharacterized protein N0V89_001241 [Didymosphaeria variabile]|uniref:Uncharacterized protein n=1 Tax=Didymosphaeria variabile TaxID=1932322 RepID=A0A9W8XYY6_9PLEO|nr:uncharacterized protein N0V89_001241 [Didymosphaeria variabile]KAJ4360674.1 hypothetical protein N0V89_001241 [Didymosphaeria variabile]